MKYLFTFSILIIAVSCFSQNCFTEYTYYRPVTLKAKSADTLQAHTVTISINTKELVDDEKIQVNAADFRVTDEDCNELSFFINDLPERENNVLYVAIPTIDENGMTIHLYYGNTTITESKVNGNAVFVFFDDFEDGVVDTSKWEAIGQYSQWDEVDGQMRFGGVFGNGGAFQYVTPKMGFIAPMVYDFIAVASNSAVYGLGDTEDRQRVGLRYSTGSIAFDTLDIIALMHDTLNGGSSPGYVYPYVRTRRNQMDIISVSGFLDENTNLNYTYFENHTTGGRNVDTLNVPQMDFESVRPFFASIGPSMRVEFVGIRPAIQALPIIEFGDEGMAGTSSITPVASDFGISIFPNPVSQLLNIKIDGDDVPSSITLFTPNGILMISKRFENIIDVSSLSSGIYFLKMEYENGQTSLDRVTIIK